MEIKLNILSPVALLPKELAHLLVIISILGVALPWILYWFRSEDETYHKFFMVPQKYRVSPGEWEIISPKFTWISYFLWGFFGSSMIILYWGLRSDFSGSSRDRDFLLPFGFVYFFPLLITVLLKRNWILRLKDNVLTIRFFGLFLVEVDNPYLRDPEDIGLLIGTRLPREGMVWTRRRRSDMPIILKVMPSRQWLTFFGLRIPYPKWIPFSMQMYGIESEKMYEMMKAIDPSYH